ncbi:MAG TPA: oxidoreductase [Spirochaetota bacterium]|nr:oxidoreductase [Spirochaetota bacterium]HPI89094.1 oxidoreductase [Spirochaetota bacterium]HPR48695.1 oxidoreductase [Spirochaetota bacterium]
MKQKTALLVGATGLVGGKCLQLLLESDRYERVTVLVRRPTGLSHRKLNELRVNFDDLENHLSEMTGDDVFCCLGTTIKKAGTQQNFIKVDHDYVLAVARAARAHGAGVFLVISAMGANPASKIFYNRVKGTVEQDLRNVGFDALHIFRPSLLLGQRDESRPGEVIASVVMRAVSPLMGGPLKKYRAISADRVARSMLKGAGMNIPGVHIHESDEMQDN